MPLFQADVYRSFAIGFALGTAAILAVVGVQADDGQAGLAGQVIPSAQAAAPLPDQTR